MAADVTIVVAAKNAGFPNSELVTATAVALAESGGNENAVNTANANGSTDYGLWQINSVHTDILKRGNWRVPGDNAKMAKAVWDAQGWNGWTAYKNGRYKLFIPRAQKAVDFIAPFSVLPGGPDTIKPVVPDLPGTEGISALVNLAKFLSDKNNWRRLGYIVLGSILVFVAWFSMISGSEVVEGSAKVLGKVKGIVL